MQCFALIDLVQHFLALIIQVGQPYQTDKTNAGEHPKKQLYDSD
jgi:hypothetical protein